MSQEKVVQMPEKQFLSAEDILGNDDVQTMDLRIPEWGGRYVKLRSLRADEAQRFVDEIASGKRNDTAVRLAIMSVVNENLEPLFTPEQVVALSKKNMRAILRIQEAALKLNGLSAEDSKSTQAETSTR